MNDPLRSGSLLVLAALLGCTSPAGDAGDTSSATETSSEKSQATVRGETPDDSGTLAVTVTGFRNRKGLLLCSLFQTAEGFPDDAEKAYQRLRRKIDGDSVEIVLEDVLPGEYAIAVLHDEDEDGAITRGFFGIPTEGAGASNNPRPRRGPPRYDEARFPYDGDKLELEITLQYPGP